MLERVAKRTTWGSPWGTLGGVYGSRTEMVVPAPPPELQRRGPNEGSFHGGVIAPVLMTLHGTLSYALVFVNYRGGAAVG